MCCNNNSISHTELSPTDRAINHYEAIRTSAREEILFRIGQRDSFSNYLAASLGTIVTAAFLSNNIMVLLAAPFASVFFTSMIIHSYEIHVSIMTYLRGTIEPELARLCGTRPEYEWEKYYTTRKTSGIRRQFYIVSMCLVCSFVPVWLFIVETKNRPLITVCLILAIGLCVWIKKRNDKIGRASIESDDKS